MQVQNDEQESMVVSQEAKSHKVLNSEGVSKDAIIKKLLDNLKKTMETPLESVHKPFETSPEVPTMRQSFLSAIVGAKQGSRLGKALHGENWKKDLKWMKQEINTLISLDKERLAKRRQELLDEIEGKIPEHKDVEMKEEKLKVIPKIRYWGKGICTEEMKTISEKLKQMKEDDNKVELEIAQREKTLAEMKLQILKNELKAKLIDLKLANRLT